MVGAGAVVSVVATTLVEVVSAESPAVSTELPVQALNPSKAISAAWGKRGSEEVTLEY